MAGCCNAHGCAGFFTARMARRAAERYRKRGVDKTARRMVAFLEEHGIEGATVLEIGGGVGDVLCSLGYSERNTGHSHTPRPGC